MNTIERATITLNETDFYVFQADAKSYMVFEQVAQAVGMSTSCMMDLGYTAQYDEKVEFIGPQTFEIDGNEIEVIDVNDVGKYWALAAVQGESKKAWKFLEAILAEALV
jgi:hypothetical protein